MLWCPESGHHSTHVVKVLGVRALVPISGTRDERIAHIARLQRGRVSRRQLRGAGISDSAISRLAARGGLHREHPGVFVVGYRGVEVPLARETSALLACRDGTVLSHLTAAALWRLVPAAGDSVEVTIAGRQTANPKGVTVHRTRRLHPTEIRFRERLPVTSVARTLLDTADELGGRAMERALDEGLERKLVRVDQIADVIARNPGRRAAAILDGLLEHRTGSTVSRSEVEERVLSMLRSARLPPPEMNVALLGFTADFVWRTQKLVVEVDGFAYHSSKSAFERDRRRDAIFRAAGWDVIRISAKQVVEDALAVIALIAAALA